MECVAFWRHQDAGATYLMGWMTMLQPDLPHICAPPGDRIDRSHEESP